MKKIIFLISLCAFAFISCQKEFENEEHEKSKEIKKLEEVYDINFEEITENEARNFISIPFDALKEYLENNSKLLARGNSSIDIQGLGRLMSDHTFEIVTNKFVLFFKLPFEVGLRLNLGYGYGMNASLNFKKAIMEYGKQKFLGISKGKTYIPGTYWHTVYGIYDFSFVTNHNGRSYRFSALIQMNTRIPMGRNQLDLPVSCLLTLRISIQLH